MQTEKMAWESGNKNSISRPQKVKLFSAATNQFQLGWEKRRKRENERKREKQNSFMDVGQKLRKNVITF